MSFILCEQRDADCRLAFQLYRKYLDANKWRFAPSAFALASSKCWFDCNDHRCPHDGRMISVQLGESEVADGTTELSMSVRLAGAWQSEEHKVIYSGITYYNLSGDNGGLVNGHGHWRYDEFRVDDCKRVLHEIEWGNGARWLIKCRDVEHRYTPDNGEHGSDGPGATRPQSDSQGSDKPRADTEGRFPIAGAW